MSTSALSATASASLDLGDEEGVAPAARISSRAITCRA